MTTFLVGRRLISCIGVVTCLALSTGCQRLETTPRVEASVTPNDAAMPLVRSSAPESAPSPDGKSSAGDSDFDAWSRDASPCVYEEWRRHHSAYALDEILDRHLLESRWEPLAVKPGVTMARVRALLGDPACDGASDPECHPDYGPGMWLYVGSRFVMPNAYCHLEFNEQGVLVSVDWSGE